MTSARRQTLGTGTGDATAARTATKAVQGQIQPPVAVEGRKRQESALEKHLAWAIRAHGLPEPDREYRFDPVRRFRLDFAWPSIRLAVEVEGGIYRGGGHTSVSGMKRDFEKGNLLAIAGWRLLRFHGDQVKSGEAISLIAETIVQIGQQTGQWPADWAILKDEV